MCRLRLYERMAAWLIGTVALAGLSGTASASSTSVSAGPASATVLNDSPVTMSFPLERTGELSYDTWVQYRTEDDTAIAGADYGAASGSVSIPAGATEASIPVQAPGALGYSPAKRS